MIGAGQWIRDARHDPKTVRLLGAQAVLVRIFVSSGDDALAERDFLDALIRDAINPVLMDLDFRFRFEVDRWERTAPHKILPDASPNDEFVARARAANLVVSVLIDELRQGTKEELEAVLHADDVELSVIWCEDRQSVPDTEVSRWLARQKSLILYDRAGRPEKPGPKVALARLATEASLVALRTHDPEGLLRERR